MTRRAPGTAVGDLAPATWRDLPALALVAGRAFARRPFGNRAGFVLAVLGWPLWWVLVAVYRPHLWHLERRALVAIYPPGASKRPKELFVVPLAYGAAWGIAVATIGAPALVPQIAIVAAFVIAVVGPYPGRLRAGRPRPGQGQPLHIALAAAASARTGLLRATSNHLVARYRGEVIDLSARDRDLAAIYSRIWGLRAVDPERGRMRGVVPTG